MHSAWDRSQVKGSSFWGFIGSFEPFCFKTCMCPCALSIAVGFSLEFSKQEYRSGLPFSPPRDLPHPGTEPRSLVSCVASWMGYHCGLPCWLRGQSVCLQCWRPGFSPWVGKIPWRREWLPLPAFLPGESHEQRSLAGYSPWGHKESDMTEQLTLPLHKLR